MNTRMYHVCCIFITFEDWRFDENEDHLVCREPQFSCSPLPSSRVVTRNIINFPFTTTTVCVAETHYMELVAYEKLRSLIKYSNPCSADEYFKCVGVLFHIEVLNTFMAMVTSYSWWNGFGCLWCTGRKGFTLGRGRVKGSGVRWRHLQYGNGGSFPFLKKRLTTLSQMNYYQIFDLRLNLGVSREQPPNDSRKK